MTDGPKWTDIAIVILTIGIVFFALMQWLEMRGAGHQTDQLVDYAKTQAQASKDIATAAGNFSTTAEQSVTEFKKAAAESNKAANEAVKNTRATIKNAETAFRDEQRAWIGIRDNKMGDFEPNKLITVDVTFMNTGKTPARKVRLHVRTALLDAPINASVITSKAANSYHFKTGQRDWPFGTENVLPCRLLWWQVGFGAPAPRAALEHVSVVQ